MVYVMILRPWFGNFGRDNVGKAWRFIGLSGMNYPNQRWWGGWALETWQCSVTPYWQNKHGDFCITKTLFYIKFSKPFFPLIALLWRPKIHGRALMLGIAFSREGRLIKGGHNGRLGMVNRLKYSKIIGSPRSTHHWSHLLWLLQYRRP